MPTLDIMNNDAFSISSLTQTINNVPFRPGRIGQLGLFRERGMTTLSAMIERVGQTLMLVPTSPRNGVPPTQPRDRRELISVAAPHIALQDAVHADEVQGVRAFGSETEVMTIEGLVRDRLDSMSQHLDMTLEWHRMGALKGRVYDSDGVSVVHDFYTIHGQTAQTVIDMDLANASPASGALRASFNTIIRQIRTELGGVLFTRVHGFCGYAFMEALLAHPQYISTFGGTDAAQLRQQAVSTDPGASIAVNAFGVTLEEYPGDVNGQKFVADDEAIFFPLGVPNLFQTWYAPAPYMETVNTLGLPRYAKQWDDGGRNVLRHLEAQTNPVNFNSRPRTVAFAKLT
ncbi:MAG: phage protein [Microvirga sp.]|jgi:hypothetical protein|nr:phage protein [Microvirga sp.]MDF2970729.1 phage protein [Microvirga sp.]